MGRLIVFPLEALLDTSLPLGVVPIVAVNPSPAKDGVNVSAVELTIHE